MYTLYDKQLINELKNEKPELYERYSHMLDSFKSELQKGCHDIRNVLALIIGNIGLLELNHPELENDSRFNFIKEDINFLSKMMNEINKARYSHIVKKSEENYHEILQKVVSTYPMDVQFDLALEMPLISIDPNAIKYVIQSLLDNIADCNPLANVRISTFIKDNMIYTSIKDDLPIIEDDTRIKLFSMFNTTKSNHTGLSLATSNFIIVAHDGTFSYSYENGNIFTFSMKI